jgi:small GTP-binding protein
MTTEADSKARFASHSVAVMGPGSVGKSAITLQFVRSEFVSVYDPTIEDMFQKNTLVDGVACRLDILDTAGQEDYTALRSTWMRERDGFILVFSIIDQRSFEELNSFYEQLADIHEDSMPPVILVGNKADLESNRQVSVEEGRRLAHDYGAVTYIETSALTAQNIEESFEALVRAIRSRIPDLANNDQDNSNAGKKKKSRSWCMIL